MDQLKTLLPYVRPYRRALAGGLVLVVVANAFQIIGPKILGLAIDALGRPDVSVRTILGYAGLVVLVALLGGAARYGMRELLNGLSRRVERDIRNDFFGQLLRLGADFYGGVRTGDLMSRATNDVLAVRMAVGPAIMYTVNTLVLTAFALIFMLRISPSLTGFALIPMIFMPAVTRRFGRIIHDRFEKIQDHFGVISTMVQENLSGARIVRAYVQEEAQEEEFAELNEQYLDKNMALVRTSGAFHPILGLMTGTGMVIVLWLGGRQVMAGAITVGDFVAFGFYLAMLIWPMIALGWVINLYQRGAASWARIREIFDTAPSITDPAEPVTLDEIRGEIEFRDVGFRYPGTERRVLEGVSFRVPAGSTTALVGPTGSGKTTVVMLIARIYDATDGAVLLDGVPIETLPVRQVRDAIGMVPQDAFLFSDTLEHNIGLGVDRPDGRPERVRAAATIAQLDAAIADFPDGIRTRLGERGINLSGGQRQRATLARALAREPRILIMDDSLSAVDTHTERRILHGLSDVLRDRTSLIVSHRVTAVMDADQILVLDEGRIVERGTHAELIAADGVYATLLRRQMLEEGLDEEEEGRLAATRLEL